MDFKIKPFTTNIVFFDTEFSGNNLFVDEILSIGMVKMDGNELYLETDTKVLTSDWVKTNVNPYLNGKKSNKQETVKSISNFLGNSMPYLLSYRSLFDMAYLYKIFEFHNAPFQEFPLDFTSFLFSMGLDPKSYSGDNKLEFCKSLGIDITNYKIHNALDDAKLLREIYLKIIN